MADSDDSQPGASLTKAEADPTEKEDQGLRTAELEEEAKFKSRYPQNMRPGGSLFLQKRLNKGVGLCFSTSARQYALFLFSVPDAHFYAYAHIFAAKKFGS